MGSLGGGALHFIAVHERHETAVHIIGHCSSYRFIGEHFI